MQTVQDLYKQRGFKTVSDPVFAASQAEPALRLTIWEGKEQVMPVKQIGKLGLQEFSRMYTVQIPFGFAIACTQHNFNKQHTIEGQTA